jgi:hypothetical protein
MAEVYLPQVAFDLSDYASNQAAPKGSGKRVQLGCV